MYKEKKDIKGIICSFVIIILIFGTNLSCSKTDHKESEPNNDFYNSNRVELDSTIEGILSEDNDRDFFIIDIRSPRVLDIELSPVKGLNHAFKVWSDRKGQSLIKYVDDARKSSPERMCNLFVDLGVYYISVLHGERDKNKAKTEDAYKLRISGRAWEREELESNDSPESANLLEINSDISGYFSPSFNKLNQKTTNPYREEDWFYFNVELEYENPILLDMMLTGVPDVNSIINLYNSELVEISSSDLNRTGEGESLKGIGITKSGKYYIMINSNYESNYDIPYRLLVTSKDYDYSSEIEPNNIPEQFNTIIENKISGRIFPEGDIDYYLYNNDSTPENTTSIYRIAAYPKPEMDIILKIYDFEYKKIFEIDNKNVGGEEIMPNAILTGNFYVEVSSKQDTVGSDHEYKLSIDPFSHSEDYEIEPNDKKETATLIKGNEIIGFISKKNDVDFYYLQYSRRVRKSFTLNGIKDSELKISITDSLGYIIKTETIVGSESKSISEMIDLKGFVIVESKKENYEEPYTIQIGE